jgi:hypothetical protein
MVFVRIDDDGSPTPIGESVRARHNALTSLITQ